MRVRMQSDVCVNSPLLHLLNYWTVWWWQGCDYVRTERHRNVTIIRMYLDIQSYLLQYHYGLVFKCIANYIAKVCVVHWSDDHDEYMKMYHKRHFIWRRKEFDVV